MTFKMGDRVYQTSITGGNGTLSLIAPPTGVQSFVGKIGDGNTTAYMIEDPNGDWELTIGTVVAGTGGGADTISRAATPIDSSNGGARIIFSTSAKVVAIIPTAELLPYMAAVPIYADGQIYQRKNGAWVPRTLTQFNADLLGTGAMMNMLTGLTLATVGSSATFSVAAGAATDSGNGDVMQSTNLLSKTTLAWAVGSTHGALDSGSIANNTWYHVFLIKRADTGVVDVLISASATAPTMPSSYTLWRRIGSMRTDGSGKWVKFIQMGDTFLWGTPIQDANGVGTVSAGTLRGLTVPTGVQVEAVFDLNLAYVSGAETDIYVSSPDQDDVAAGSTAQVSPTTTICSVSKQLRTNTTGQVRHRANSAQALFYINTIGWVDSRGT